MKWNTLLDNDNILAIANTKTHLKVNVISVLSLGEFILGKTLIGESVDGFGLWQKVVWVEQWAFSLVLASCSSSWYLSNLSTCLCSNSSCLFWSLIINFNSSSWPGELLEHLQSGVLDKDLHQFKFLKLTKTIDKEFELTFSLKQREVLAGEWFEGFWPEI